MEDLDSVIKRINTTYKDRIVGAGIARKTYTKIPFSSPAMNYLTRGGLPRGKIVEFSGGEGGGKTTSALDIVHNAQILFKREYEENIAELEAIPKRNKTQEAEYVRLTTGKPKRVVYVDAENTLDEDWAIKLGVDIEECIVIQPDQQCAEEIFQIIIDLILTNDVGLVVLDSIGVLVSKQEFEKTLEEKTYGGISQPLTTFSKKATQACARNNTLLIAINQLRDNLASSFGGTKTVGGRAWKHHCSYRLQFNKGRFIDDNYKELSGTAEMVAGNLVEIAVMKNKVTKPDRRLAKYTLKYETGVDVYSDLFVMAEGLGYVIKSGSWYQFINKETGEILSDENGVIKLQGMGNVVKYLKENKDLFDDLLKTINEEIIQ